MEDVFLEPGDIPAVKQLEAEAEKTDSGLPEVPSSPPTIPPATPREYMQQESQLSTPTRNSTAKAPKAQARGFSWKDIGRITVTLLDTGVSIYDAVQVSRQKAGYLPPKEQYVRSIQSKYPQYSSSRIRGAMQRAEANPRHIQEPSWLQNIDRGGMPTWGWVAIAAGGFLLLMKSDILD